MRLSIAFLAFTLLLPAAPSPTRADEAFSHPAGAFRLNVPTGWRRIVTIDQAGMPCYVFTPDNGGETDQVTTGLWVTLAPISTDDELQRDDAKALVEQTLAAEAPGLTTQDATPTKLGGMPGTLLELRGKHNSGNWNGQVVVAIQNESFLIVRYGCPREQWPRMQPVFERILAGFVAPVPHVPFSGPRLPHAEEAPDAADKLALAVPLVHIMCYADQDPRNPAANAAMRQKLETGWGSGFVVRFDGYIITNRHVVAAAHAGKYSRTPYDPLEITWDQSGHLPRIRADVVGVSRRFDLALLKIADDTRKWPSVPLSDISQVRNADRVLVMGWPDPSSFGETDVNHNEGTLTLEHDERGRVGRLRHSARTTGGNSGGPLYDLNTGTVIGIHSQGLLTHAHDMTEVLYHGTIPIDKALWEFPEPTAQAGGEAGAKMTARERQALIAYYFLQQRFGAALFECKAALAENPNDGVVNAYLYRIYAIQGSPELARPCLKLALGQPESQLRALIFAARTAFECDNLKGMETAANEAVRVAPDNSEGYLLLGEAEIGMGRVGDGEAHLERAKQLARGFSAEAEVFLGWAPLQRWLVENQVNKMPWSITFPADLAAKANEHFSKSYKQQSSRNWVALANLGFVAGFSGDANLAEKYMDRVLSASGDDPDAILCKSYYFCLLGKPDEALKMALAAMDARETPRGHFILAWAILLNADAANKAGKPQDAQGFLKLALAHEAIAAHDAPEAFWEPIALNIINQFKSAVQ